MHKVLLLFLIFSVSSGLSATGQLLHPSDSNLVIFESLGKKGIKNKKGKVLLAPKYEALSWENNPNQIDLPILPYKKTNYWGILGTNLKEVTEAKYVELIPYTEELLIAATRKANSQMVFYGLVNLRGDVKMALTYRRLFPAGSLLIAALQNGPQIRYGIVDDKGKELLPFDYFQIEYLGHSHFLVTSYLGDKSVINLSNRSATVVKSLDSASYFKEDISIIYKEGKQGLLSAEGKMLLPIAYKQINFSDGQALEVSALDEWHIFDKQGTKVADATADSVYLLNKDTLNLIFQHHSFVRSLNKAELSSPFNGTLIQSFGINYIMQYEDDIYLVDQDNPQKKERLGKIIGLNNDLLITQNKKYGGKFYNIINASGARMEADGFVLFEQSIHIQNNGFWGVYTTHFQELVKPLYKEIYHDGYQHFIVNFQGNFGVIDSSQQWMVAPDFKALKVLGNSKYWALTPYLREWLIGLDSKVEADLHYMLYDNIIMEENMAGELRMVDLNGKAKMSYLKGTYFNHSDKGILLKSGDRISYIKANGKTAFNIYGYDSVRLANNEFLPVFKDGAYGFIDLQGKLRIANRYNAVQLFNDGLASVKIGDKWGYVNKDELLVIQPYYDFASDFKSGVAIIRQDGQFGLIDKKDNKILEIRYDSIARKGSFYLLKEGRKWGVASLQGNMLQYPNYDQADIMGDFILLKRYKQFKIIDTQGTALFPDKYDAIYYDSKHQYFLTKTAGKRNLVYLSDLLVGKLP